MEKTIFRGNHKGVCKGARRLLLPVCTVVLFLFQACASTPPAPPPTPKGHPKPYRVGGTWYKPMPHAKDFSQQGIASWYGKKFHGRKTSSGEVYNMYAMTAAHKTLPLGTWVRVRHLNSGKQIVVRVNDRGPFIHGRIIDLSYTAAKELDMVGPGTARVEVVALGERRQTASGDAFVPMDYYSGAFTFQVGAFSSRDNAERLRAKLNRTFTNAHVTPYDRGDAVFYRVRVGRCNDLEAAVKYERHLANNGYPDAFIVAE
ncbi:MAG: septal ring lytic transglycosylase RlpA family protein [Desulfosarcina sp.]|nr:septal ring lytic transglycosylase RlpA family protein [Desulfosarcina sp.]MBC2744062.1 septal ring lytic transglycosylase RlpA family protein [Desulfosarcina sp.]MBC2766971.1 septal ring lytic transglycosylase RlpA family protein [Desulfosarcina sp.]